MLGDRSMTLWRPAYIGLGSNLQDPRAQLLRAFDGIERIPSTRLVLRSPLYGSRPFGPVEQADYVNAAAGVLTQLDAPTLLHELRELESAFGRPAVHVRWGPRILDLDLLLYGREMREEPDIRLPHPGIVERNFVLYPLADIAPDLDVPGLGRVAELKGRITSEGIWPLRSSDTDS